MMGDAAIPSDAAPSFPHQDESPFPLTEVDKWVLSQTDEEFHCHDWEELKTIIGALAKFSISSLSWAGPACAPIATNNLMQRRMNLPY
jgi:hypothetical protein